MRQAPNRRHHSIVMAGDFSRVKHFGYYDDLLLLGPPIMRGAIVFSGSSHPTLVDGICDRLGTKRGSAALSKFANGETSVQIRTRPARCALMAVTHMQQRRRYATKMSSLCRAAARGW
jgi:hypothetical protein